MSPWLIAVIGTIYIIASLMDASKGQWLWMGVWACYGVSQYLLALIRSGG